MKTIAIVLGTAREGRESWKVARVLVEAFKRRNNVAVSFVDVRDHLELPRTLRKKDAPRGAFDEWQKIAEGADVFIFVLPEYHRGYPGEWKLLIDSLDEEYRGKRGYIAGVSSGIFGGVRMGEHIKPVLIELGLVLSRTGYYLGNVESAFTTGGELADEAAEMRLEAFVDAVLAEA